MSVWREGIIKEKKRRKIDLKIEVRDFGPISGGKISFKPLTLFIGPNNSGKSYIAMLVHSIYESFTPPLLFLRGLPYFIGEHFFEERFDISSFLKEFPDVKRQIDDLKAEKELEIPKQVIEKVTNVIFADIYEKRLSNEVVRSYACLLRDLTRIGKKSFALKIDFNSYSTCLIYQKDKLKIKKVPQLNIKIKIKAIESPRPSINIDENGEEILIKIGGLMKKRFMPNQLMAIIFDVCVSKILGIVAMPCYYLPAARSGILQGHKALAASIVKKAPYVGIERLEIPKFSGVVSDFISSVLTLPDERGPFYQLAKTFEEELVKGEIVVRTLDEYRYPEIKYKFQDTEIPLHRASSTVSELAPLFLYLKYSIERGSILIIEEPEAHLHPGNQRILAKALVALVRKGVNIIITTHSEYLLEQLNNFILLSKVDPQKRIERYKYSQEDFLNPDEIAPHVFEYDRESAGHKITEVEITDEDGISQDEFVKIHEALYEETIKIRRDLSAGT